MPLALPWVVLLVVPGPLVLPLAPPWVVLLVLPWENEIAFAGRGAGRGAWASGAAAGAALGGASDGALGGASGVACEAPLGAAVPATAGGSVTKWKCLGSGMLPYFETYLYSALHGWNAQMCMYTNWSFMSTQPLVPFSRRVGLVGGSWAQVTVQHTPPWSTIWKGSLHRATVRKVHSMSLAYVGAPRHREFLPVGHQGGGA